MRRTRTIVWGLFLGALATMNARAVEPTPGELQVAREWVNGRLRGDNLARLPFSFRYDGRSSRELLSTWRAEEHEQGLPGNRTLRTLVLTDPRTGLVVRCQATSYRLHPAVEWVLSFKNAGTEDTPILDEVRALDTDLCPAREPGVVTLYHAEGSHEKITDFQPRETRLAAGDRVTLAPFGGRSSDGSLPFFNLAHPDGGGVAIGVGWTGQWSITFTRLEDGGLTVQSGLERLQTRLRPGEEIRTPAILLLFWSGQDRLRGQNLLRRLLLEHYAPTPGGKPVQPLFAASPHAVVRFESTTEANMRQGIQNLAARGVPLDYWWIDTGWFPCGTNWARYVGNPDPDPVRFPNGLKPVSDQAHSAGYRFLLWFEPERVMPGTWLHQHHSEWLLQPASAMPEELKYQIRDGFHLLDLGNPEARRWLREKLSAQISELGIDCYRNDFNMYPDYYWRNQEPPDRQGMKEVAYVTGLYDLFDALQREHPHLLLDNCASGGRRIDFEMLRRSLVLTRSDYLWDPTGQQCHTYGLAQWIPITGIGAASLDRYSCRSGLGSHYTLAADYYSHDDDVWNAIAGIVREWQSVKDLFTGDFYPLSPYSTGHDSWMAWQFDRADRGDGLVQAFRRPDCTATSHTCLLQALDPTASYEVINRDDGRTTTVLGHELMSRGLIVQLDQKPAAALVTYRKLSR